MRRYHRMEKLRLTVLGGFDAAADEDRSLVLATRKARALLAVVGTATEMRAPREELAAMLWERSAEEQAKASLRQTLSSIRKALGGTDAGGILDSDGGYVWLDSQRCEVDAVMFEAMVAAGAIQDLARACRLYGGDFLAGFSLRELTFQDWLTAKRARLEELARRGLSCLMEHHLEHEDFQRATETASHLLAIDPLQENAHRALMRVHAREGRRASAIRQFATCRELLQRDLGVAPDEETLRLAESIRQQPTKLTTTTSTNAGEQSKGSDASDPMEDEAVSPAPVFAGEIRPVTVVFIGLLFDEPEETADIELYRDCLTRFRRQVNEVVTQFGGRVDRQLGESIMATFGIPVTFGNDAERALRAASAMCFSSPASDHDSVASPAIRVGIATGQAVAGGTAEGFAITGDTIELAHQLEMNASAGEVLATDSVCQAAERFIEFSPLEGASFGVRGREIRVHRVSRLFEQPRWARSTRFVGRKGELRQAESVLYSCLESGYGQGVYIRGEPGIGKTRLVEEIVAGAQRQGFICHKVLIFDFGTGKGEDVPRSLTRSLLGIDSARSEEARAKTAQEIISSGQVSEDHHVFLNDLLDLPQPVELRSLYDAMENSARNRGKQALLRNLVAAESKRNPLMLVVEDVHWAEPIVLDHLASLARTVPDGPAVLVMTSRIEGDPLDRGWRAATRETPLLTLDLGPLRKEEAETLAREISNVQDETLQHCLQRAQGNPLFLEQLLKMSHEDSSADVIPGTVQELVLARSDRLTPPDKAALQAASILGQRFSLVALRHLVGDPGYDCQILVARDLVRPEGSEFLFAHALIRDGIYAALLPSARETLHEKAAEWFRDRDGILFAIHLEAAGDPRAPRALLDAAAAESRAYRSGRALDLMDRGLAGASGDDRFELLLLKGELLHFVGTYAESIETLRQAVEAAVTDVGRCKALTAMAVGLRQLSEFEDARSALDEAEPVAEAHGLLAELARIYITRGNLAFRFGDINQCLPHQRRALEFAQHAGSKELEVYALGGLGDGNYAAGRMRTAQKYLSRCAREARNHGFGRIEVAHRIMGTQFWMLELRENEDENLDVARMATRIGSLPGEMQAYLNISWTSWARGAYKRAEDYASRALALAERLGAERSQARCLHFMARPLLETGQRDKARLALEKAHAMSVKTGTGYCGAAIQATMALAADDDADRDVYLQQGEEMLGQGAVAHNFMEFYSDGAEVRIRQGRLEDAKRYGALLKKYFAAETVPLIEFLVAKIRSLCAFYRGDRGKKLRKQLEDLEAEALRADFRQALPSIQAAIQTFNGER